MLILRTCSKELKSRGGFQWPESGLVEAPDWKPTKEYGSGLHGLPWGEGKGGLLNWGDDAKWLVVDVPDETVINLGGKVKFPKGNVVFCGDRDGATEYIVEKGAFGRAVVGGKATAGDDGTLLIRYWDKDRGRYRIAVGYIGENGLKPNIKYHLNEKHEFEEVDE